MGKQKWESGDILSHQGLGRTIYGSDLRVSRAARILIKSAAALPAAGGQARGTKPTLGNGVGRADDGVTREER
jgi:hypothetical protein